MTVQNKLYSNSGNKYLLQMMPQEASKVLDIGCGAGDNAAHLKRKGIDVDGITLSKIEAKQAKRFCKEVYIHDLENGLPQEVLGKKFDVCICSHVLEHICWPENLLLDIKKVLNLNGILLVALPNLLHYKSRLELLKGNFNYTSTGVWDNTHFRWYTYTTGRQLLEKNGFNVTESKVSGILPLKNKLENFISDNLQTSINSFLHKVSPGFFGTQLLYKAKINICQK